MRALFTVFEKVLNSLAIGSTFIMMMLTTFDAGGRYIFNHPLTGALEITEKYLMVAVVFMGIGLTYRQGSFIRVELLIRHLRPKAKVVIDYLGHLLSLLLNLLLLIATTLYTLKIIPTGLTTSTLNIPLVPAYAIAPLGFLYLCLLLMFDLPKVRKGESDLFKADNMMT